MRPTWCILLAISFGAISIGCSEYGFEAVPGPEVAPEPEDLVVDVPDPVEPEEPEHEDPVVEVIPEPDVTCADVSVPIVDWFAGPAFTGPDTPMDAAGVPFYHLAFDPVGYRPVSVPDRSIPVGMDGTYLGVFDLSEPLPPTLMASLQSDDGIWVYLNGVEVGHWGGEWQEEGCVNENAECIETTRVEPLDVLSYLQPGENVVAVRVSNPIMNSFFDVLLDCQDI